MPRSGSGSGGGGRGGGGSRSGSRSYSTSGRSYSQSPPPPPPKKPSGQQPGLMKQAAVIAGGVVAGNMLTAAILGAARESIPPGVECQDGNCRGIPEDDPCALELKNFIECAYRASEMTQCDGYNTLLKECRRYEERHSKR